MAMKIKLTPPVSYLIGLWKHCRTREGIGIVGSESMRTTFLSRAMAVGIADASKVKWETSTVFFFHSAYRTFFDEVLAAQTERFCHANDYAAAFLAGIFDGNGGVQEGKVYLEKWDKNDEIILLRLNFKTTKAGGKLWIGPADVFLKFIKNWTDVERPRIRKAETTRGEWMKKRTARKTIEKKSEKPEIKETSEKEKIEDKDVFKKEKTDTKKE